MPGRVSTFSSRRSSPDVSQTQLRKGSGLLVSGLPWHVSTFSWPAASGEHAPTAARAPSKPFACRWLDSYHTFRTQLLSTGCCLFGAWPRQRALHLNSNVGGHGARVNARLSVRKSTPSPLICACKCKYFILRPSVNSSLDLGVMYSTEQTGSTCDSLTFLPNLLTTPEANQSTLHELDINKFCEQAKPSTHLSN
jgi:hypothetical protein